MRKSLRCVLCVVLAVAMLAGVSPAVVERMDSPRVRRHVLYRVPQHI